MKSAFRKSYYWKWGCALGSGLLFVLTLFRPQWIEAVLALDPDRGSGLLEWAIVAGLLAGTLISAALALVERTRSVLRREGSAAATRPPSFR